MELMDPVGFQQFFWVGQDCRNPYHPLSAADVIHKNILHFGIILQNTYMVFSICLTSATSSSATPALKFEELAS